jgi:hypothetical protein
LCHVVQLAVEDAIIELDQFRAPDAVLHQMARISNPMAIHSMTSSRCPVPVDTRWLSRESSLFWRLARESIIKRANLETLIRPERERFTGVMKPDDFRRIEILHHLIYPFAKCIKFCETRLGYNMFRVPGPGTAILIPGHSRPLSFKRQPPTICRMCPCAILRPDQQTHETPR